MITDEKELVLQFMDLLAGEMLKAKQYSEWHKASWHDAFRFIEGHARYKALVAAFYQNPDLTKKVEPEDNQGWIKWSGGKQPVPDGTKIQVRFRSDYFDAEIYSWSNEACDEDIIAYRIKPNTVKPENKKCAHLMALTDGKTSVACNECNKSWTLREWEILHGAPEKKTLLEFIDEAPYPDTIPQAIRRISEYFKYLEQR